MPRFVVLEHDSPHGLHWDFMLEMGSVLATWSLEEPPNAADSIDAEALADHRSDYLDYEGPISGGRGTVTQWDRGIYQLERSSELELVATLSGRKLTGRVAIVRSPEEAEGWQFSFTPGQGFSVDPAT